MTFSPKQMWCLNLLFVAITLSTGISWATLGLSTHWVAIIGQATTYSLGLLHFVIQGDVPGFGMSTRDPRNVPPST